MKPVDLAHRVKDRVLTLDPDPSDPHRPYLRSLGPVRYHDSTGHRASYPAELLIRGVKVRRTVRTDGCGNAPALWVTINGQSLMLGSWPHKPETCAAGPDNGRSNPLTCGPWQPTCHGYRERVTPRYGRLHSEIPGHATCQPIGGAL